MSRDADRAHWFESIADHLASMYLRYSFTKGTRQEVDHVVRALGLGPGDRVLDVGCGPGRHAHELARRGVVVHGIDIAQTGGVVPDKLGGLPEVVGDRVKCIVIAVAAGKNNDAKFHGFCFRGGGNFYFTRGRSSACVRHGNTRGGRGTGRVT